MILGSQLYEELASLDTCTMGIRPGGLSLTKEIVDKANLLENAKILDVGCGKGVTVNYLRNTLKLDAMGIDASTLLINEGKKCYPELMLSVENAERLSFNAQSFDSVLTECALSTFYNPLEVLEEINRILKPSGKCLLSDIYLKKHLSSDAVLKEPLFTLETITEAFTTKGFKNIVIKDCTTLWQRFMAELIWNAPPKEEETLNHLCRYFKSYQLGYFYLIAEKK